MRPVGRRTNNLRSYVKMKDTFCSNPQEICDLFDYILEYQTGKNQPVELLWYNYLRMSMVIMRLYRMTREEILEIKTSDIIGNAIVINNKTITVDNCFIKYLGKAVKVLKSISSEKLCCNLGQETIANVDELRSVIHNFQTYCKKILARNNQFTLKSIALSDLSDSIIFYTIYKYDSEVGCNHDYEKLKMLFIHYYKSDNLSEYGLTGKTVIKYELYLKWVVTFYNDNKGVQ